MTEIEDIKKEIAALKERNIRVESEKAWEVSAVRVATVAVLIYLVSCGVFFVLGTENFYLGALVPPVGYFVSMQSIPLIKRWWMKRYESERTLQ